ncbi:NADH-quinone oxidoreductase subunit J [Sulfurivirga sp.]|uniref:NADH-quinone oxidoreductase subunit J n=1 Tax=Sulfurivirga sp. TaxID=2614236 RepID=UPI0025E532B7|nr:NADH-quinone oxidoreductase subunit J [Sulfurivirga sp.]
MSFEQLVFYAFAAIAAFAGLMVITVRNPVKAALWLVLAFVSTAAVWILAEAEFLGLVLILVYVGAVLVLFLFVVMMLDINLAEMKEGFARYLPIGVLVSLVVFGLIYMVVGPEHFGLAQFKPVEHGPDYSNTKEIAVPLYTQHAYAFVLAAVLLLVGIVAAIALTLRRRPPSEALYQDIDAQVRVRAEDRLTMVKMPAEVEPDLPENKEEEEGAK